MMIIYRVVAKHSRPDTDWETTAVISAVQFAPGKPDSTFGGSKDSNNGRDITIMAVGTNNGIFDRQEKFPSSV
jgi:hypothetical protein